MIGPGGPLWTPGMSRLRILMIADSNDHRAVQVSDDLANLLVLYTATTTKQ
jgi:hypothetical protein